MLDMGMRALLRIAIMVGVQICVNAADTLDVSSLSTSQLRSMLKEYGLSTKGPRHTLLARLIRGGDRVKATPRRLETHEVPQMGAGQAGPSAARLSSVQAKVANAQRAVHDARDGASRLRAHLSGEQEEVMTPHVQSHTPGVNTGPRYAEIDAAAAAGAAAPFIRGRRPDPRDKAAAAKPDPAGAEVTPESATSDFDDFAIPDENFGGEDEIKTEL